MDGTSSTDRRENARVPVVVFTGLSQSVAKKLKQVQLQQCIAGLSGSISRLWFRLSTSHTGGSESWGSGD